MPCYFVPQTRMEDCFVNKPFVGVVQLGSSCRHGCHTSALHDSCVRPLSAGAAFPAQIELVLVHDPREEIRKTLEMVCSHRRIELRVCCIAY